MSGKFIVHARTARIGLKLDKELDHQGSKENKPTSATNLHNELGEVVDLELKGSAFGITSKSWGSKSDASRVSVCMGLTHPIKTLCSDGDNNVLANTFEPEIMKGSFLVSVLDLQSSRASSRVTFLIASDLLVAPGSSH